MNAPVTRDFTQKDPVEGAVPTDQLEVRFVYDDVALYVATRVTLSKPRVIQAPLGRRVLCSRLMATGRVERGPTGRGSLAALPRIAYGAPGVAPRANGYRRLLSRSGGDSAP